METNYELKHKCLLVPLRAVLLVLAMVLVGFTTYAQQDKSVKVANDRQLIEAMDNPSVFTIELAAGYYSYINYWAESGNKVIKQQNGGGNRSSTGCTYYILAYPACYNPNDVFIDPEGDPHPGFSYGQALAGVQNSTCLSFPVDCCPIDGSGRWSNTGKPAGAADPIFYDTTFYDMNFWVNKPGVYLFTYTWDPLVNDTLKEFAEVETEYYFFGPDTLEMSAPDVCGTTTWVDFIYVPGYDPNDTDTIEWFVDYYPYGNRQPIVGPSETDHEYELTVDCCGKAIITVKHTVLKSDNEICIVEVSDTVEFSCEPIADAGPDAQVCYYDCYTLNGSTGLGMYTCSLYTFSENFAYTWVQLDGPYSLIGLPASGDIDTDALEIGVCRADRVDPDICPFGVNEIVLQVTNGLCYDADTMLLTFYEPPTANAGPDTSYCAELCFSLAAVPYDYCGEDGVNYFKHAWWELVSSPFNASVDFDELDPISNVCVIGNPCAYGEFTFRWNELNVKVVGTDTLWSEAKCFASDEVTITIFEQPIADAGDDYFACVDAYFTPYTFMMDGNSQFDYCYTMYGQWSKSCSPGDVVFSDIYDPNTEIAINAPGKYIFQWKLWNEECADSALVTYELLEQPEAIATDDQLEAPCDLLCYSMYDAGIVKYDYFGTDQGDCPNYKDRAHWSYVSGPNGVPEEVTFADDTDPQTAFCVWSFGCYTLRWNEVNRIGDNESAFSCSDYVDIGIIFVETPTPFAGDDASLCGNCYTMDADPFSVDNCRPGIVEFYWSFISYTPPEDPCPGDDFAIEYSACWTMSDMTDPKALLCICDDCFGSHYGTYEFAWVNSSGFCVGTDNVVIEFKKAPEEVAMQGWFDPANECVFNDYPDRITPINREYCPECWAECIYPGVIVPTVCAESCHWFSIDWDCFCGYTEEGLYGPIPGYTYEWSFIGPAGSTIQAEPLWYDCENECWRGSDQVHICFGECCDTAILYLTITAPNGCVTTEEWKFNVLHKPCVDIVGPEITDVGSVDIYCNDCELQTPDCLLYDWTVEPCGVIQSGQGTECIEVLWTDYVPNGGWGKITLTVFDTCTLCCNYDEMMVKVHPAGTVGEETLSGQVFYHNNFNTPINGVEITLWNGGVPVMTTESYVKFVDEEPPYTIPGYYEFPGIDGLTPFGITGSFDRPWFMAANATDALAVQLKSIFLIPGPLYPTFVYDDLVAEAMDVNNSNTISSLDALWIKQRAISMVNYFPAGDWAFWPDTLVTAGTYDVLMLNYGDANRSNIPSSTKSAPAIDLLTDGTMNVSTGQEFELPIRIADANTFGAITLDLGYNPALIEVVDVVDMEGMVENVSKGNVSIAWSNPNPMVLANNDVVLTLKVKALAEISNTEPMFSIGIISEFADQNAQVIEPVTLKTYGISTGPAASDYFLSTNRPNPFSTSTFIEYTMPETGKVKLTVLDMLGQELAVLVDATQTAGSYTVEFSAAGLATGVYIYKFSVDGETRDFISTQRMVISH